MHLMGVLHLGSLAKGSIRSNWLVSMKFYETMLAIGEFYPKFEDIRREVEGISKVRMDRTKASKGTKAIFLICMYEQ